MKLRVAKKVMASLVWGVDPTPIYGRGRVARARARLRRAKNDRWCPRRPLRVTVQDLLEISWDYGVTNAEDLLLHDPDDVLTVGISVVFRG